MSYKISMPHRHTVIYENGESKIAFEVELGSRSIILYTNSPKFLSGDENNLVIIVDEVRGWLENKFSKVILDDSPPVTFNL